MYNLEINRPTGGEEEQKRYLERELAHINYFFDKNRVFYSYYRSGDTHLDEYYFLRKKSSDFYMRYESFYFERDPQFSTHCDFKMAKVLANEKVEEYVKSELRKPERMYSQTSKSGLVWTASKADLSEMALGCYLLNSFNGGSINQNELKKRIEEVFNIDLGNFSRTLYDLSLRNNSTQFLDKLKKAIEDYFKKKLK